MVRIMLCNLFRMCLPTPPTRLLEGITELQIMLQYPSLQCWVTISIRLLLQNYAIVQYLSELSGFSSVEPDLYTYPR